MEPFGRRLNRCRPLWLLGVLLPGQHSPFFIASQARVLRVTKLEHYNTCFRSSLSSMLSPSIFIQPILQYCLSIELASHEQYLPYVA